ncbi:MAG: OsmC family protein [Candidatus Bathyarchaeota archaeon]|nr:OsmC family protein [Candidatus Bathyarchaeota archaeon]
MPKIKAKATWLDNVRSVADNQRTHSVVCDLSTAKGGADSGPTALELALMGLADCGVTIFADVCKKSNIELNKVEVTVEAEKSPDSPLISGVSMKVSIDANARKELVDAAWRRTEASCPVLLIFKQPLSVQVSYDAKTQ